MRKIRLIPAATVLAAAAALTGCAVSDPYGYPVSTATPAYPHMTMPGTTYSQAPVYSQAPAYANQGVVEYGRVTNVALVNPGTRAAGGVSSPAGALLGGVVGGVVGNQIGSGSGRAVATILGAAAGAAVGNRVASGPAANYNVEGPVYRVWVQTDQGATRTFDVSTSADLRPGDRVRIDNGMIYMG